MNNKAFYLDNRIPFHYTILRVFIQLKIFAYREIFCFLQFVCQLAKVSSNLLHKGTTQTKHARPDFVRDSRRMQSVHDRKICHSGPDV